MRWFRADLEGIKICSIVLLLCKMNTMKWRLWWSFCKVFAFVSRNCSYTIHICTVYIIYIHHIYNVLLEWQVDKQFFFTYNIYIYIHIYIPIIYMCFFSSMVVLAILMRLIWQNMVWLQGWRLWETSFTTMTILKRLRNNCQVAWIGKVGGDV